MAESDPLATQRDIVPDITGELATAGFDDAQEVGRGGFGVVYRCRQSSLDRTVAVKVLTSDLGPEDRDRFIREQLAMGKLSGHPHIVAIHQVGTTASGHPYIVMEYHPHDSLATRIRRQGPLDSAEALRIAVKVAGAVETGHRLGILHRDVKPANILLTQYGEPALTDFGIARIEGGFQTSTGTVTGSPAFTAPEVLKGLPPSPASDVYSLGATLFCAVTGHAAFERRTGEQVVAQFLRITNHPVPDLRPEGIPGDMCDAIERAMSGDPADRFATAAEFGDALRQVQRRNRLIPDAMALPIAPPVPDDNVHPGGLATARRHHGYAISLLTPPAASTKFHPPSPTRSPVRRGRLLETMRAGNRRLTVIHAPTGYGKSTLAAQWREHLVQEGVEVAWFTVDHDDNNVVWFLAHLIEAIRQIHPQLANQLVQTLEDHGDQADRYVLTSLINEIDDTGEDLAIVIEDWHQVTDAATRAAMSYLIDKGGPRLQIIVTSRDRSGLPLSRMRVRDELLEIDSTALRFSVEESRSFLVDLSALPLDESVITELADSTEGWAAALQLAAISLRRCEDPGRLVGHMSGRHHAIGEFLAENVLNALEPAILDFLLSTSITEQICGPLAAALAQVDRGQAMLEEVEARDLFLRRTDEEGSWFRYHHLFAEFLRERLERDHPERINPLHRIASDWFADHRNLGEAVDHALAAADPARAVELVERDGTYLLEHAQMSSLLGLVAKLPPPRVQASPRLQLTIAWANSALVRPAAAQTALDRAYSLLDRSQLPDSEIADLRVEADVIQSDIMIAIDQVGGVHELVTECLSRPDTLRPLVVSAAADNATFLDIYRFDFNGARRRQAWASQYHERTGGPFSVMYGYCVAGIADSEQLDIVSAEANFREALRVAVEAGGIHSHAARLASALLGELLYERGDIAEAERLLDESHELGSVGSVVDFMLARYGAGARIKALRGDREAATRYLEEGSRTAAALSLPRLRARIEYERGNLGFPATTVFDGSRPVGYKARPEPVDGVDQITIELEEATAIRLLLLEDSPERVMLACNWAAERVAALDQGRRRALLAANRLLATCLAAARRIDEAKTVLCSVTAECARVGMVRYVLDEGPELVSLIAMLREDRINGRWRPEWPAVPVSFLEEILAAAGSQAAATRGQAPV